jgi:hypothetical protein
MLAIAKRGFMGFVELEFGALTGVTTPILLSAKADEPVYNRGNITSPQCHFTSLTAFYL